MKIGRMIVLPRLMTSLAPSRLPAMPAMAAGMPMA